MYIFGKYFFINFYVNKDYVYNELFLKEVFVFFCYDLNKLYFYYNYIIL